MFFENVVIDYFNLMEGAFWCLLGIVALVAYYKVNKTYKAIALFSFFILLTFGVSDFFQVVQGSFLVEGMQWLFIWKIVDVIGLCIIPLWYLILRTREHKSSNIVPDS